MGRVYCMWQLVFADITNNNELSIMNYDWMCSPDTCMLCWTQWYTWPDWTSDSITDCLYYCSYMLSHSWRSDCIIIILYFITLYARAPSSLFYTLIGSLTPWICTSRPMIFLLLIRYLGRIICVDHLEGSE